MSIFNGPRERMERQGLQTVDFNQYDGVISPVNTSGAHWKLVYLHAITNTIFMFDPLNETNDLEIATEAFTKFGDYFKMRQTGYGKEDWVGIKWKPGTIQHSLQTDSDSCGVFVMLIAKQVMEDFPNIPVSIPISSSENMMCHHRRNLAKEILQASVTKEEYCSLCVHQDGPQAQDQCILIKCELCQRWYHVGCLKIEVPPEDQQWFCRLCL
ncbi:hypothetical protein IRJ41_002162 [Triplophysa rosa]|uniref:PHD-type domain-containing protein n=1 Tax=Triplophysa rosa TaxID=992332 RepID=A0A9W7T2V9_TRIRA|nr:hypothetical protein IRJ41_002162 [Triplophysa rosa]